MARTWTPVFYREDFPQYFGGATGGTLILDDWAQIDPTETIVFPKSVFQIQKILQVGVQTLLQVTTREYPYSDTYYIDARFVKIIETKTPPQERTIKLPNRIGIVRKMKSQVGKPYVWWGNANNGVPLLTRYYRSQDPLTSELRQKWTLDGFDCSGLLYWATDGYTPRNTSKLITFGTGLEIVWKTPEEIASILRPLDLIVWKGHNMIVIDGGNIIESTVNFTGSGNYSTPNGVRIRPAREALEEIMTLKNKVPLNNYDDTYGKNQFVIRRWFPWQNVGNV